MEADWSLHTARYLPIGLAVKDSLPSGELKEVNPPLRGSLRVSRKESSGNKVKLSGMSLLEAKTVNLYLVVPTVKGPGYQFSKPSFYY